MTKLRLQCATLGDDITHEPLMEYAFAIEGYCQILIDELYAIECTITGKPKLEHVYEVHEGLLDKIGTSAQMLEGLVTQAKRVQRLLDWTDCSTQDTPSEFNCTANGTVDKY